MPDPLINQRLGRYQIHQEIGRGGMARVYRATDTLLQRQIALKILAPQLSHDPEFATRFEREAVTAANLRHPAIITIFDVGESDGLRYIAMEYIAGRTLNEALAERGKLSLPLCVAVLGPVADALQYAHSQGAVHRDVKPHNILIDTDGRVLLTDFGIAVGPKAGAERLTQAGMFMGTPEYLSPEQAQAQPPGSSSDIYSLGIVAFEALAGRVPFEGAAPQLIMAHVYTAPPALTALDPSLPRELDPIMARTLAKEPGARFAKASDVVEALRAIAHRYGLAAATREDVAALAAPAGSSVGRATILMGTPPAVHPAADAQRGQPGAFPIGNVFGEPPPARDGQIAEIFGDPPAARADPRRTPAAQIRAAAPAPPPHATRRPTPPDMVYPRAADDDYVPPPPPRRATGTAQGGGLPWSAIVAGLVALLLVGLIVLQTTRRGSRAAGRGNGDSLTGAFAATSLPVDPTATATPFAATVTPLGPTPTPVPTNAPGVLPAPTDLPTATPPPTAPPEPTAIPPTAPPTEAPPTATAEPTAVPPTVAPTATPEPSPTIAPTDTTAPLPTETPAATATAEAPVATPVGGGVSLVFQSGPALTIFDTTQGSAAPIDPVAQPEGPAAIAPDGSAVLFDALKDGERHIYRYDKGARTVAEFVGGDGAQYHPAWSPDGSRVVFVSTRDGNPEIYVATADGQSVERLTNDPTEDDYPSFSADGSQIIWERLVDDNWRIFAMTADGFSRIVEPVEGRDDGYPRVSPDGSQLVFVSNRARDDGGFDLYLQALPGGEPERLTNFPAGSVSGPQWSPDGRFIVFFGNARGNNDIYIVPTAGGEPRAFTNSPGDERWPVWGR